MYRRKLERLAPWNMIKNINFGESSIIYWFGKASEERKELVEVIQLCVRNFEEDNVVLHGGS